jgi:hypothetical protein
VSITAKQLERVQSDGSKIHTPKRTSTTGGFVMQQLSKLAALIVYSLLAACTPITPPAETPVPTAQASAVTVQPAVQAAAPRASDASEPTETITLRGTIEPSNTIAECPEIGTGPFEIDIDAAWQEGDTRSYELTTYRKDSGGEGQEQERRVATDIQITVLDSMDTGYALEWVYGESRLVEPATPVLPSLEEFLQQPAGLRIEYATDRFGAYRELRNVEEVQSFVEAMMEQILDQMAEAGGSEEEIEGTRRIIQQLLSDPTGMETLFLQEVQLFHALNGFLFDSLEPIQYEDLLPNALGGEPIPSQVTIRPTRYSAAQSCARIEWTNEIDAEKARESIVEGLMAQAERLGLELEPPEPGELPEGFTIRDELQFDMDLASVWPRRIHAQRTIQIGERARIDERTFVDKSAGTTEGVTGEQETDP